MVNTKIQFLEKEGLLNPKPERVKNQFFKTLDFFDAMDLPQVRYEMLRAARIEKYSVAKACKLFGFSREYFYKLERNFKARGYSALIGSPKGRRPLIAINQEIVTFIVHQKITHPKLTGENLRKKILNRYKVDCSRRTVERVIENAGLGKKGPSLS